MSKYKICTITPFKGLVETTYEVDAITMDDAIKKVQIIECVETGKFKAKTPEGVVILDQRNEIDDDYHNDPERFDIMDLNVILENIGEIKRVDCWELGHLETQEDFEKYFNLPKQ